MNKRWPLRPTHPSWRSLGDCYLPPKEKGEKPGKGGGDIEGEAEAGDDLPPLAIEGGALTLKEARDKGRRWLSLLSRGVDPKVEAERLRAAELRKQANTFGVVAAEFLNRAIKGKAYLKLEELAAELCNAHKGLEPKKAFAAVCADPANATLVKKTRLEGVVKKAEAIRVIEGDFVKRWGPRPITDILPQECAEAIRDIAREAPYEAHNRFGYLRRLFNWAVGTQQFGLTKSPVEGLRPKDLIGKRAPRNRLLTDDELRAIWKATGGPTDESGLLEGRRRKIKPDQNKPMGYPFGPLIRLMILSGQRENELARGRWSEIDFEQKIWTTPAERMKNKLTHILPLAPDALALLESLPRFSKGDAIFSTTDGEKPVSGFSKAKRRVDRLSGVNEWIFHDLRRAARTHFSALPVQDNVRELVIAHSKKGLHKVYDLWEFLEEKRECLELWEQRLRNILSPKPSAAVVADVGAKGQRRVA